MGESWNGDNEILNSSLVILLNIMITRVVNLNSIAQPKFGIGIFNPGSSLRPLRNFFAKDGWIWKFCKALQSLSDKPLKSTPTIEMDLSKCEIFGKSETKLTSCSH